MKDSAAPRRKTIGAVIDECLAQAGIKPIDQATELVGLRPGSARA